MVFDVRGFGRTSLGAVPPDLGRMGPTNDWAKDGSRENHAGIAFWSVLFGGLTLNLS